MPNGGPTEGVHALAACSSVMVKRGLGTTLRVG